MLQAAGLQQRYGRRRVLRDVALRVPAGGVLAVMGHNGSGKTTLLRILAGLERPAGGEVRVDGRSAPWADPAVRQLIGYLPQVPALFDELTVRRQLEAIARLCRVPRIRVDREIERCALEDLARRPVGRLSSGQRQRVGLAACLLHDPRLLLFDEPTGALDPASRERFADLLARLRGDRTVVMVTHQVAEAVDRADQVLVLHGGSAVATVDLAAQPQLALLELERPITLPALPGIEAQRELAPGRHELALKDSTSLLDLGQQLAAADVPVRSLQTGRAASESRLLKLIAEGRT